VKRMTPKGISNPMAIMLGVLVAFAPVGTSPSALPHRSGATRDLVQKPSRSDRITAPDHDSNDDGVPDSVTVLLFGQAPPVGLDISSNDRLSIGGDRPDRRRTRADVGHSGVRIDGEERGMWRITSTHDRTILLASGRHIRRVRGIVTVESADGRLVVTARMSRMEYLVATLGAETTSSDPMEYLVALSVLQRNYLTTHRRRHAPTADLCDNSHCQVADLQPSSARLRKAVARAERIALTADGGAPCYYSANCGGSTLTPERIWHTDEPGYSAVRCPYCATGKWYRWSRSTAATAALDRTIREFPPPPFVDDDFKIRIGRMIGFNVVLSNTVDRIERRNGRFVFHGRGFGHRVGLCCDGARQLARNGKRAADILRYYFPDARLTLR